MPLEKVINYVFCFTVRVALLLRPQTRRLLEREKTITLLRSTIRMCDLVGPVRQGGKKLKDLLVVKDALSLPNDDAGRARE